MKKITAAAAAAVGALVVALLMVSSLQMELAESAGPDDCMDACTTGCVQRDTRLMARCEGKCRIRCADWIKLVLYIACAIVALVLMIVVFSYACSSCCRKPRPKRE